MAGVGERIQLSMETVLYCRWPRLLHAPVLVAIWCTTSVARKFQQVPTPQNILVAGGSLGSLLLPCCCLLQAWGWKEASLSSSHKMSCVPLLHEGCVQEPEGVEHLTYPLRLQQLFLPNPTRIIVKEVSFRREWFKPVFDVNLLLCVFLLSLVRNYADVVLPKMFRDNI